MDENTENNNSAKNQEPELNRDWFLFGLAIFVFAIVTGAYIGKFASSSISSDPANWGQFGDYVGGLMNPLLSVVVLWTVIKTLRLNSKAVKYASDAVTEAKISRTEEENRLKRQNTMDVYSQFHTKEMIESRNAASKTLNEVNKAINYWDLYSLERENKTTEFEKTITFLSFFEKVNIMKKAELIDEELLYSFFFRYYQPFYGVIGFLLENTPQEGKWTSLLVEVAELHWWFKKRGILLPDKN